MLATSMTIIRCRHDRERSTCFTCAPKEAPVKLPAGSLGRDPWDAPLGIHIKTHPKQSDYVLRPFRSNDLGRRVVP